ncbi:MAG: D-alanine--D-alanine ligase [Acidobacteriota bacterium]|nr:D-alanine--D-alanine ligase [Acidobacteriota bacterium]
MKKKIRLGILFGGRSGEHEVSIASAASVLQALDRSKYRVTLIAITRKGCWLLGGLSPQHPPLEALKAVLRTGAPVLPSADPSKPGLLALSTLRRVNLDVVFPLLHGTFGEDGTVQGLLELSGIPYVGAGVLGSSASMDKDLMKRLFRDARLPIVPWILILRRDWGNSPSKLRLNIEREIGYPAFVKPANLGSSVGVSKVTSRRELGRAIDLAANYDRKIIVEKGIDAREIECSVLGNDDPKASAPGEIVPVNEFYDYSAKYLQEGSKLIIPARLTARQSREVRDFSLRAFKAVDCAGMARVDFLLDRRSGQMLVNEINTIPGFTSISMYPKLWEVSGLPYPMLVDRLVDLAIDRHREKQQTRYDYTPAR